MERRAEDLPSEKKKEDEQQHGIAADCICTTNHAKMREQTKNEPDEHEDPVTQSKGHGFLLKALVAGFLAGRCIGRMARTGLCCRMAPRFEGCMSSMLRQRPPPIILPKSILILI